MLQNSTIPGITHVPSPDVELVSAYLDLKWRAARGSYNTARHSLIEILYTVSPRPVADMDYHDLVAVVQCIDTHPYTRASKLGRWATIATYYRWALDRLRGDGHHVNNNLPLRVQFSASQHDIATMDDDEHTRVLSDADLASFEVAARIHSMGAHVLFLLLQHCGMRHAEAITIRVENVHVDERYLVTGLERNARKSKKPLYYFYPRAVALRLRQYLLTLPTGTVWLFPSETSPSGHISHYIGGVLFGRVHAFRHTIITRRLDAGCPLHVSELLQNHQITAVQFRNYYRKSLRERRDFYDRYHPY